MENTYIKVSSMTVGQKWGVIMGVVLIIFSLLTQLITDPKEPTSMSMLLNCLFYIAFIVILFLAINDHKKIQSGFLSLGEGFKTGAITSAIAALLSSVYIFINAKFINPEQLEQAREMINIDDDDVNSEMMEQIIEFSTNPILISVMSFFVLVLLGLFISIIISAIIKKDPPLYTS